MTTTDFGVDCLAFDTGGTVFDWHSGVLESFRRAGVNAGVTADWAALTKTWRKLSTDYVKRLTIENDGQMDQDMDDVLHATLKDTLSAHGVRGLEDEADSLVHGWRTLPPWPDAVEGLARLRTRFVVVSFTILRTALVIEASRRAGIQWDAVFSCEMTGLYKTAPASYRNTARWLDAPPDRVILATAHNNDLTAAHANGFRTAFIRRPAEWGGDQHPDPQPAKEAEWIADDIVHLADLLGV